MNKTKNYILALAITIGGSLWGYDKTIDDNFGQSLTYKKGPHIPLIMILDQSAIETVSSSSKSLTHTLNSSIQAKSAAILVSQSILFNFFSSKELDYERYQHTYLSDKEWELYCLEHPLYFTEDNLLFLLIPKEEKSSYSLGFNFQALKSVPLLKDSDKMREQFKPQASSLKKGLFTFMQRDLEKIFLIPSSLYSDEIQKLPFHQAHIWEGPLFDLYLTGHGLPKPDSLIADFTVDEMQQFLTFLNNKLRIGVLMLSSCYAGGENLRTLRFKNDINDDITFSPLHFTLIVLSPGDNSSYFNNHPFYFQNIFYHAQHLGKDYSSCLNKLLLEIESMQSITYCQLHGEANIPQIILPGGIEIQSLDASAYKLVLGKIKVKNAEIENKPLCIYPKKVIGTDHDHWLNVLLYPSIINTPIIMKAARLESIAYLSKFPPRVWGNLPTFSEIINRHKDLLKKNGKNYFFLNHSIAIESLETHHHMYPNILSMIHGDATHYLKKLIFEGNIFDGSGGVLMGIRDSFFDIANRSTLKTFYIDRLEGPNDITLLLKTLRLKEENYHISSLETELPKDDAPTVLKNVILRTQCLNFFEPLLEITFQLNKTAWQFKYTSLPKNTGNKSTKTAWTFSPIDAVFYKNEFIKIKKEFLKYKDFSNKKQKSLISVLKKH